MVTRTLSQIEFAWIILGFAGLVPNIILVFLFLGDYLYLVRHNLNGARRMAARYRLIIVSKGSVIEFIFLLVGLIQAFIPNVSTVTTPAGYVLIFGFFLVNMLIGAVAYYTFIERQRVVKGK